MFLHVATSCAPSAQVFQEVTSPIQCPLDQCSVEQVLDLTVMKCDINEDGPCYLMDEGWQKWNTTDHQYCFPGNRWGRCITSQFRISTNTHTHVHTKRTNLWRLFYFALQIHTQLHMFHPWQSHLLKVAQRRVIPSSYTTTQVELTAAPITSQSWCYFCACSMSSWLLCYDGIMSSNWLRL